MIYDGNRDTESFFWEELNYLFGPFNDCDVITPHNLIQPNLIQLDHVTYAIQVHVKEPKSSRIFIYEGITRTCDIEVFGHLQTLGNSLGKTGLATAEFTAYGNYRSTAKMFAEKHP